MPVINLTVLQDVLGSTEPVDAVITATVNRASVDAYRVNNQFVIFPRDIKINVTAGEPDVDFVLTALPTGYYWHVDIFVNGEAPVRRTVIVPEGNGPFDFEDLIDVAPETAVPDTSQDVYEAWLDQILAAAERNIPAGGTTGQVLAKVNGQDYNTHWVNQTGGEADLTVPTAIKDTNGDDFITFTRTGTNTARIGTPQDDLSLRSARDITLIAGDDGPGNVYIGWGDATIAPDATNKVATIADVQSAIEDAIPTPVPLPDFLTYAAGRTHLPSINTHFGWDAQGLWFGNAIGDSDTSYPVFTNFTIGQNDAVIVEFNVDIQDECSDIGLCVYLDEDIPEWNWGINQTRIAAQFDCVMPILLGLTEEYQGERSNIPNPGMYRVKFTYNPIGGTPVQFEYYEGSTLINSMTLNETLGAGSYRVGFASDNNDGRTYISDLSITVNEDTPYTDTLQNGASGGFTDIADFIFDASGDGSTMTIHNHDMVIRTTRDNTEDADISLDSADDIWITANDTVELTSQTNEITFYTNTNGHQWAFGVDGYTKFPYQTSNQRTGSGEVLRFSDSGNQSIITGPAPTSDIPTAQRLVVAGQDGYDGTDFDGEGGDIYLWAGRGGGTSGDGGDIKIDGGNGGSETGEGGYVKVRGGDSQGSNGGFVEIFAGDSYSASGGNVTIVAGNNNSVGEAVGGSVNIYGGGSAEGSSGGGITLETYQNGKITLSGAGGEFLNDSTVAGNQIATISDLSGLVASNANAVVKTVNEAFTSHTGATGVVAHDYSYGAIFNHSSIAANFTVNVTNLVLASGYGTSITLILNQGATARIPSALQIGGVAQTINWQGGSAPTGNANKKDVVSFSILNVSGTYTVLGQLVSFG